MQVQQELAFNWCKNQVGNAIEVIIDKPVAGQDNVWIARSFADAPDVDALVYVTGQPRHLIKAGQIVPVEVVGHQAYDLLATSIGSGS